MIKNETIIKSGLRNTPVDKRDFSYKKVFGKLAVLPEEDFLVGDPLEIKDQLDSDLCAAFGGSSASELQEGVTLSPEWLFAKAKELEGDFTTWGLDLRIVCKVLSKLGSLEKKDAPFTLAMGRNFVADWSNWPLDLDKLAIIHKKKSYFNVNPQDNLFDSIRQALWENKEFKRAVLTGCIWKPSWIYSDQGIVKDQYEELGFGHAFIFIGQKKIDDKIYLVAQLSNGTSIGDNGLFYFSKEVVNKHFKFGAYMFVDILPEEAKILNESQYRCLAKFKIFLLNLFK